MISFTLLIACKIISCSSSDKIYLFLLCGLYGLCNKSLISSILSTICIASLCSKAINLKVASNLCKLIDCFDSSNIFINSSKNTCKHKSSVI